MRLTLLHSSRDKATDLFKDLEWPEVISLLTEHDRRPEKEGRGFSPVTYGEGCSCINENGMCPKERGHLLIANVQKVHLLGIDLDKSAHGGDLPHWEALQVLHRLQGLGVRCVAHSTHSYAPPEKSTWRLFFALSRPITGPEFRPFWRAAIQHLGIPTGIKTDNPARFWHLPSTPTKGESVVFEGDPLNVDQLLKDYVPPDPLLEQPTQCVKDRTFPLASEDLLSYAAQRLQDHGQAVSGDGGDNHTFVAAHILMNDYALSYEEAWPMFRAWNQRNVPPWPEGELSDKLHGNYATEPYGAKRDSWEFFRRLERPPLTSEPGTFAHALAQARVDIAAALSVSVQNEVPDPFFQPAAEILTAKFPPTPWLIRGIMTEGGLAALSTEPKSAKTWAATEMAIAIAMGDKAFGEFQSVQGGVAYFYAEDMGTSIRNRLRSLLKKRGGRAPVDLFCQPRGRDLDITNDESLAIMLASARQISSLKLLVLDPFRDIHAGAEDSSDEMAGVMRRLRILGNLLGCTILFIHHSAKSGADVNARRQGQKMRGSSAIHGAIDSGLYFSGLSGDGECTFTNKVLSEVKGAKSAGNFNLTLDIVDGADGTAVEAGWTVSRGEAEPGETGEGVTEIVEHLGNCEMRRQKPPTGKEILKGVKGTKVSLDRNLLQAESGGYIEKHRIGMAGTFRGWKLTHLGKSLFEEINRAGQT